MPKIVLTNHTPQQIQAISKEIQREANSLYTIAEELNDAGFKSIDVSRGAYLMKALNDVSSFVAEVRRARRIEMAKRAEFDKDGVEILRAAGATDKKPARKKVAKKKTRKRRSAKAGA